MRKSIISSNQFKKKGFPNDSKAATVSPNDETRGKQNKPAQQVNKQNSPVAPKSPQGVRVQPPQSTRHPQPAKPAQQTSKSHQIAKPKQQQPSKAHPQTQRPPQAAKLQQDVKKAATHRHHNPVEPYIYTPHLPKVKKPAAPDGTPLRVIPLGGMREVGKNMFVYEYQDDIIIVDCGIGFPEENMPGIDVVIPDMTYVFQNKDRIRGIFFTHGHEDHIGAVAWLTNEVRAPIYGSKLAVALIQSKLEDRGGSLRNVSLNPVNDGAVVDAGVFSVEFIHSNHSIADANILAIRTPVGLVVHTGDFKIDFTPINGDPMDLPRLALLGQEKPLLLMCESTNVEKQGSSMSESKVGDSFAAIFERAPGRIIVATFSSNIFRMQQIITAAEHLDRKICLIGRSIVNVFSVASSLGYMKILPNTLIDINQIKNYPANKIVIISTGSQGEPLSALTRMAFKEHQKIEIMPDDTVILSSTPIPGNEKPIYRVINELYLRGANVIYASLAEVHASGHAYQDELKLMHRLVQSKFFVPMHGEYRMLHLHSQLAQKMGMPAENIHLLCNGDVLELTPNSARIAGYVPAEGILVDGSGYAEAGNAVLKDRISLAEEGVITVAVAVDVENSMLVGDPVVYARGFVYETESDEIIRECKNKVINFVRKCESSSKPLVQMMKSGALREQLRDFLFDRTRRKPIIIISIIEL